MAARSMAALTKRSELRASSADKAVHLLDLALAHRACIRDRNQSSGLSHMLFTLHVYQCRVEKTEHGTSGKLVQSDLYLFVSVSSCLFIFCCPLISTYFYSLNEIRIVAARFSQYGCSRGSTRLSRCNGGERFSVSLLG